MPTILPTRATTPGLLDPFVHLFQALRRGCRKGFDLARTVIAEETAQPERTLEELISDKPLRTKDGNRVSAGEMEDRVYDL